MPSYLVGLEERNFGMHSGLPPGEALASDEALEAFKLVVLEASRPADDASA